MKCQVDAVQWGGGVVAECFRRLQKPTRLSGGGGSSRIFSPSPKAAAIQWGGGSSRIFPWSPKATDFPLMGPFKQNFWAPPGSATDLGRRCNQRQ